MAVQSVANLKAFINANITSNGTNSNNGANLNTLLIDVVDSFFSVVSTPAVLGSGTANKITRWGTSNTIQAGTWTHASNDLVPDTNNSSIGSSSFGVQNFLSAATSTTAPLNFKSSVGTNPSTPSEGMLWYNGTNLYFRNSSSTIDILSSSVGSGTLNTIPLWTPSGTQLGDSPLTVSSGNVSLLSGTMGINVAADPSTGLYIDTNSLQFPLYVFSDYTGGSNHTAIYGQADGVNSADNIGGEFRANNGTNNIGVEAKVGGTVASSVPSVVGLDDVGVFASANKIGAGVAAGVYSYSRLTGAGTSYSAYFVSRHSSTGEAIGIYTDASTSSGTSYIGQFKDGNEGAGKIIKSVTADGKSQWTNPEFSDSLFKVQDNSDPSKQISFEASNITTSTTRTITMPDGDVDLGLIGGWYGSQTRIKIAPWDIVSYADRDGVYNDNDGGIVNDSVGKITTMITGVYIPSGYRATAFMINASANVAIELFESQIDDATAVSKGSGNANTEVNITNVDSTDTNYLSITIVEAGNDIYGGYITIEKI